MKQNADTNERTCKFQRIRIDRKECMHHVREIRSNMILTGGISCTPIFIHFFYVELECDRVALELLSLLCTFDNSTKCIKISFDSDFLPNG